MVKGFIGSLIAVGFFGMLFWWFASSLMYDVFTGYGMDATMSGVIVILCFAFFLGMLVYGVVKSE